MMRKIRLMIFFLIPAAIMSVKFCLADQIVKVAFGNTLSPWVIPESDSGIAVDIIKECLEPAGYKIENIYVPYARRITAYQNGEVDAASDINAKIMAEFPGREQGK